MQPRRPKTPQNHSPRADYSGGFRRASQHQHVVDEASKAAQRMVGGQPLPQPPQPRHTSFDFTSKEQQLQQQYQSYGGQPVAPPPEPAHHPMPQADEFTQQASHTARQQQPLPTDLPAPDLQRSDRFAPPKKQKFSLHLPLPSLKLTLASAVTVFVLFAGYAVTNFMNTNPENVASVQSATDEKIQDDEGALLQYAKPHEGGNPPSVTYYRTSSSYPRVLDIPKIGVEARVLPLSIAPTGALKSPANIYDLGWYKDSAKPGEDGAMVINGHTAGEYNKGVFYNLESLKKGDLIEVEDGAGNTYVYTVQDTKVFPADDIDMSSVMKPFIPNKKGLNLVNAAGRVDPVTQEFAERVVVYAVIL